MRKLTILDSTFAGPEAEFYETAADLDGARDAAPWAAEIIPVEGGWIAYEDRKDADVHHNAR